MSLKETSLFAFIKNQKCLLKAKPSILPWSIYLWMGENASSRREKPKKNLKWNIICSLKLTAYFVLSFDTFVRLVHDVHLLRVYNKQIKHKQMRYIIISQRQIYILEKTLFASCGKLFRKSPLSLCSVLLDRPMWLVGIRRGKMWPKQMEW